jgi:hypothetical protein
MIKQHPLILLTPVKENKVEWLQELLAKIKVKLHAGTETAFQQVSTLHYGRWVILSRESFRDEPAVPVGIRLIFSTNYDGDLDFHLTELCTGLAQYIDDIYACCEGYPELGNRTTESRKQYLEQWMIKTSAFFVGAPLRTVKQIRQEKQLKDFIWQFLVKNKWDGKPAVEIHRAIRNAVDAKPEFEWSKQKAKEPSINWKVFLPYVLLLLVALPLVIVGAIYLFLFHELRDKNGTLTLSQLPDSHIRRLEQDEDLFPQNQFTQVAVMKPGFIRRLNFQIWMLRTRVLAGHVFVKGKLLNIPTIHFARWVLIDNNRHVLFFSNFDGSWQQYLGDFIDQSGWGLSGIFSNTVYFPKTRFMVTGGAYDEEHFLAWSRSTQIPTQAWYCAYPDLSIKNINNNTKIRNELRKDLSEKKARIFLKRF